MPAKPIIMFGNATATTFARTATYYIPVTTRYWTMELPSDRCVGLWIITYGAMYSYACTQCQVGADMLFKASKRMCAPTSHRLDARLLVALYAVTYRPSTRLSH